MNAAQPHKPARTPERLHWTLAVIIVLGVQSVWLVWLDVVPPPAGAHPPEPTHIVFMPLATRGGVDAETSADALEVWSPALFALPDAMGFSQRFLTETIGLHPPLDTRVELAMTLYRPETFLWPAGAIELQGLREKLSIAHRRLPLSLPVEPALFPPSPEARRLPRIVILDGLSDRGFEQTPLDHVQALSLTPPWEAEVHVEVDEAGIVRRVLYERRPSDPTLATALIRAVYAWRMTSAETGSVGRVYVSGDGIRHSAPPATGRAP